MYYDQTHSSLVPRPSRGPVWTGVQRPKFLVMLSQQVYRNCVTRRNSHVFASRSLLNVCPERTLPLCRTNLAIWLGYPFSKHADSGRPRNSTLYTRPCFVREHVRVWTHDYTTPIVSLCVGVCYSGQRRRGVHTRRRCSRWWWTGIVHIQKHEYFIEYYLSSPTLRPTAKRWPCAQESIPQCFASLWHGSWTHYTNLLGVEYLICKS